MSSRVRLLPGDCIRAMRLMAALGIQVDSIVTDPPYHLTSIVKRFGKDGSASAKDRDGLYKRASAGFMGKKWDGTDKDGKMIAFKPETWALAFDVLKPGGHLLAFGGTRGWHRMACAIEDAGFEIRDTVAWIYGAGFPKSHNVSKGIDRGAGAKGETVADGAPARRIRPGADQHKDGSWETLTDRTYQPGEYIPATPEAEQWNGWGTALKPAFEPIVLARKPLGEKSVAANVLAHGTGAINVGACRVDLDGDYKCKPNGRPSQTGLGDNYDPDNANQADTQGRWPANVCHDGSEEVEAAFAAFGENSSGRMKRNVGGYDGESVTGFLRGRSGPDNQHGDSGTASRFFYSAKAGPGDRFGSKHPTVKPVSLMRWLVRMITPPGGLVLDPFAGSGSTGIAAIAEGMRAILIEADPEHQVDIREHLAWASGKGRHALSSKARNKEGAKHDDLPLFKDGRPPGRR